MDVLLDAAGRDDAQAAADVWALLRDNGDRWRRRAAELGDSEAAAARSEAPDAGAALAELYRTLDDHARAAYWSSWARNLTEPQTLLERLDQAARTISPPATRQTHHSAPDGTRRRIIRRASGDDQS